LLINNHEFLNVFVFIFTGKGLVDKTNEPGNLVFILFGPILLLRQLVLHLLNFQLSLIYILFKIFSGLQLLFKDLL
jgi:hypothetical protein